jgi:hypothetical protein
MSSQGSGKRGKQSTAQKRGSSRHDFSPIPATSPVDGASGKRENEERHTSDSKTLEHQDAFQESDKKE